MQRLILVLACLATPAMAEIDVRQLVIDTARASNCVITEAIADATFPSYELTLADLDMVLEEMIAAGEGEIAQSAFHLSSELCTGVAAEPPAPVIPPVSPLMGRVIEVFHAHGCKMTEAVGLPAFLAAGITEDDLGTLSAESDALAEAGLMIRDETTYTITIAEPLCSGAVVASDPEEPLIRMLTENGCALTQDEAAALVSDYGITMEAADEMADSLMDRGLARIDGERLVLNDCGG